jgi:small-conductance mechanosensitive channel
MPGPWEPPGRAEKARRLRRTRRSRARLRALLPHPLPGAPLASNQTVLAQLVDKVQGWFDSLVLMAPNLAVALAVLVAFWFVARLVGRGGRQLAQRASGHRALASLAGSMVRFLVFAAGFIIALNVLELDKAATTFLAGAGILGLVIGFAFQDITANFIAGVALAFQRPLRIGQLVETNDVYGTVEHIALRSTQLRTPAGQIVTIPNRKIYQDVLVNYSDLGRRRVDLEVGVAYHEDLEAVARVAVAAVQELEHAEPDSTDVVFTEFGDSSINLLVRFWISPGGAIEHTHALSAALVAVKRAFDEHRITIPFPIRTLDFGIKGGTPMSEMLGRVPLGPQT